jgi:3-hydroxyisobutyrate dehydrogenase-like beta-hydroxyacid dehydrogenase
MGAPMLAALRAGGFAAKGHDIRPDTDVPAPHFIQDPRIFAAQVETLFTVVRDQTETDALLFGDQNLAQAPNLQRLVICSTLSPRYLEALRQRIAPHISMIDAPMSGAQIAAQQASLSFMLGGSDAEITALMPLLRAMGQHFHHMGPFGAGMQAKVLNNLLAASNTAMTRLVLDWAEASALDPAKLLALINTSSGQNWLASGFDQIEFAKDGHAPGNTIAILIKDVQSALDAAPHDHPLPRAVIDCLSALKPYRRRS